MTNVDPSMTLPEPELQREPLDLGEVHRGVDSGGDGRDEIALMTTDPGGVERVSSVLPGSVAPGVHDVDEVGIRVHPLDQPEALAVGDQNGDGTDDVAITIGASMNIISGADIMEGGVGSTLPVWPDPVDSVDGGLHGRLLLAGDQPTLVTIEPDLAGSSPSPPDLTLVILADPRIRLRTPLDDADLGRGAWPHVDAYREAGDRFVLVQRSSRSGTTLAIWNLDTPCPEPDGGDVPAQDQP